MCASAWSGLRFLRARKGLCTLLAFAEARVWDQLDPVSWMCREDSASASGIPESSLPIPSSAKEFCCSGGASLLFKAALGECRLQDFTSHSIIGTLPMLPDPCSLQATPGSMPFSCLAAC